ncbi:MAG: Gfo/Idh/MocA family oxidoreductase [Alphaproteobacteria bacterium]|nr:Gfo/Idh/MocA family oxidoreductase [Alphaproteobacteria bacterium]
MRVLQVGFGAFGASHLAAWRRAGIAEVTVIDPSAEARSRAEAAGARTDADWSEYLALVDLVDVVTPTDRHHLIAAAALAAGRPVFIEKPMTATVAEAEDLAQRVADSHLPLQLGLYCRFHPKAIWLRDRRGDFGRLRYVSGTFAGLKRGRRDAGALANDAIHFIDLANWLLDAAPRSVFAEMRDHSGRGIEDLALVLLTYPDGALAKIEAGYIQPGGKPDPIVPGAITTKRFEASGERGVGVFDLQADHAWFRTARHESRDGMWVPVLGTEEVSGAPAADAVAVLAAEFTAFLGWVRDGISVAADVRTGLGLARVIAAAQESARTHGPVELA